MLCSRTHPLSRVHLLLLCTRCSATAFQRVHRRSTFVYASDIDKYRSGLIVCVLLPILPSGSSWWEINPLVIHLSRGRAQSYGDNISSGAAIRQTSPPNAAAAHRQIRHQLPTCCASRSSSVDPSHSRFDPAQEVHRSINTLQANNTPLLTQQLATDRSSSWPVPSIPF